MIVESLCLWVSFLGICFVDVVFGGFGLVGVTIRPSITKVGFVVERLCYMFPLS